MVSPATPKRTPALYALNTTAYGLPLSQHSLSVNPDFQMKTRKLFLSLLLALCFLVPIHVVTAQKLTPQFKPRVVVVQFEEGTVIGEGAAKTNLTRFDHMGVKYDVHRMERVFPFLDSVNPTPRIAQNLAALRHTYYVHYGAAADPEQVSKELALSAGVVYAEPVLVHRPHGLSAMQMDPNDARYQEQTYLRHIRLPEAWDIAKSGDASSPVVIAVVDGGAHWRHEDLLANVWINKGEIPGNGIDDDGNGVIDDVYGANFGSKDPANNDPTARAEDIHGTATSSVAGAVTNNATGIAGAAWNAKLMHISVYCGEEEGWCNVYKAIMYAAANGADIINVSGGELAGDRELRMITQSLDLATDMGSLIIASAGNDDANADVGLAYPQAHPRVLSVGATEKNTRKRATFSQYGKTVDVFAPGVDVTVAAPDNKYITWSGTSFSAPLVSGVAALIKTRYPEISPDSLREQLRLSSENMDAENPSYAGYLGNGFVNAKASLQPPTLPAVRVKRWSWTDDDGDREIDPGDLVTINATMINYLADAQQLVVELAEAESYPYITLVEAGQSVGVLGGGDSVKVTFKFSVSTDVPPSREARFYVRIRDGKFTDVADVLLFFGINQRIDLLYTAFKALYLSTGGGNWSNNSGWDITVLPTVEQMAGWYGVIAHRGQVNELKLPENNLNGSIPPELGQAHGISVLDLSGNSITGPIPAELGQLSELKLLDLKRNSLSGKVPSELRQLSNLEDLDLAENSLRGSIPPELGELSNLLRMGLSDNSLSGQIPAELGQLSNLKDLDLAENSLSGSIPPELGELSNLLGMGLSNNSLSGQIPAKLGQLSKLEHLDLSGNSLTGPVPPKLGQLSELALLDLSGNSLTGTIPRSFLGLKNLVSFYFGGQDLCIPKDDEFQTWLKSMFDSDGPTCGVSTAISAEDGALPETFTVLVNYPNPFRETTRLTFDLPWQVRVHVEVTDVIGRHILTVPGHTVEAGWGKSIELNGGSLPAGLYLYRLIADSPAEQSVQVGHFVRIR